jgi:hypothetical protein
MEPFKADPVDWEVIESESGTHPDSATIRELRDRVVALELFGGLSRLDFIQKVLEEGVSADIRELRDRVAALEAPAAATTPPPAEPPGDPQTLHTVALGMVDTLERSFHLLPQIVGTLRRAIREPMVADGGPVATDGEIADAANQCLTPAAARRAIYNLGRQHATPTCPHIRQGDSGSQYCDLARQTAELAPLPPLEAGQKWRRRDKMIVEVNPKWSGYPGFIVGGMLYECGHHYICGGLSEPHAWDLIELVELAPTPFELPEPDGVPLVTVIEDIFLNFFKSSSGQGDPMGARRVIHAVADWCRARYDMISNGHDCVNLLRQEAGR